VEQSNKALLQHFSISKLEDYSTNKDCLTNNKAHSHNHYIILLISAGQGMHIIDFKEYALKRGRIFFISSGQVHQFENKSVSGYYLSFDLDFYHSVKSIFKLYDFPFFHTALTLPYLDSEDDYIKLYRLAQGLDEEYHSLDHFGKLSILRANLENLLIYLTRIRQKQQTDYAAILIPNNEKLRKLELLIEEHYKEHKDISFYASQLNISARHLNHIIAKKSGKSISVMIQDRLLMEAQRQLLHTEMTVNEIAYALGFSDKAYFHRFFKKYTGITPRSFRNNFLR
jgi:AraC-like DNA-binding protein